MNPQKSWGHSIPLSKREIEEDILEELCSLAKRTP